MLTLTEKERLFVLAVAAGARPAEAAIQSGYSPATAPQAASRLMKSPKIIAGIELAKAEPNHPAFCVYAMAPKKEAVKTEDAEPTLADVIIEQHQAKQDSQAAAFVDALNKVGKDLKLDKSSPEKYLEDLMLDENCDPKMRFEAAKALLPYRSRKLAEAGKKEQADDDAKAAMGSYATATAPKLRAVN
jgi:phage terminase small subunit